MTVLVTPDEMYAAERRTIDAGTTADALMRRAAEAIASWIDRHVMTDGASARRITGLVGPGNNGGDGFVVARLLQEWGWQVLVHQLAAPATEDTKAMAALWSGPVREVLEWSDFEGAALVVDAMFGIGLQRDISAGVWGLLEMAKTCGCKLVAVDILSGICTESGRIRALNYLEWPADLTVTFQTPKPGHYLAEGGALRGALAVVPLGLTQQVAALLRDDISVVELTGPTAAGLRKGGGHKFNHGHALVLAGEHGFEWVLHGVGRLVVWWVNASNGTRGRQKMSGSGVAAVPSRKSKSQPSLAWVTWSWYKRVKPRWIG